MKPGLFLLPNLLGENPHHEVFLPSSVDKIVATLDGLIAESATAGRRFLGRFKTKRPALEIPIAVYDEKELDFLLEPIRKGERWGFVSDCGAPCVADPGHKLVLRARQSGISVQAFVGPSSILLALMLSGLPGQHFTFHGYFAKGEENRVPQIKRCEKGLTHIFMEAPYRNQHAFESLLEALPERAMLCVASELTMPDQMVLTQTISQWKKSPHPSLNKRNTLFLFTI